jgi:hypothetical protein
MDEYANTSVHILWVSAGVIIINVVSRQWIFGKVRMHLCTNNYKYMLSEWKRNAVKWCVYLRDGHIKLPMISPYNVVFTLLPGYNLPCSMSQFLYVYIFWSKFLVLVKFVCGEPSSAHRSDRTKFEHSFRIWQYLLGSSKPSSYKYFLIAVTALCSRFPCRILHGFLFTLCTYCSHCVKQVMWMRCG